MPKKKYCVTLTDQQRTYLAELISSGTCSNRKQTRARILLKADEGEEGPAWSDQLISEALDVTTVTVRNVRRRFTDRGLVGTINRKRPDRVYERKIDGEAEARLTRLACSEPPEGRSRWTLRLLADKMVELGVVESVSHETIRKVLKKTSSSPGNENNG